MAIGFLQRALDAGLGEPVGRTQGLVDDGGSRRATVLVLTPQPGGGVQQFHRVDRGLCLEVHAGHGVLETVGLVQEGTLARSGPAVQQGAHGGGEVFEEGAGLADAGRHGGRGRLRRGIGQLRSGAGDQGRSFGVACHGGIQLSFQGGRHHRVVPHIVVHSGIGGQGFDDALGGGRRALSRGGASHIAQRSGVAGHARDGRQQGGQADLVIAGTSRAQGRGHDRVQVGHAHQGIDHGLGLVGIGGRQSATRGRSSGHGDFAEGRDIDPLVRRRAGHHRAHLEAGGQVLPGIGCFVLVKGASGAHGGVGADLGLHLHHVDGRHGESGGGVGATAFGLARGQNIDVVRGAIGLDGQHPDKGIARQPFGNHAAQGDAAGRRIGGRVITLAPAATGRQDQGKGEGRGLRRE